MCRPSAPLRCSPPGAAPELALAGHTNRALLRSSDTQPLSSPAGCASRRHTRGSTAGARAWRSVGITRELYPVLFPFSAADWVCAGGTRAEPCPSSAARGVLCPVPGRVGGAPACARPIGHPQGSDVGSPFLWVLSFGEAKESTSPTGETRSPRNSLAGGKKTFAILTPAPSNPPPAPLPPATSRHPSPAGCRLRLMGGNHARVLRDVFRGAGRDWPRVHPA